jgi:hypothetical protein
MIMKMDHAPVTKDQAIMKHDLNEDMYKGELAGHKPHHEHFKAHAAGHELNHDMVAKMCGGGMTKGKK